MHHHRITLANVCDVHIDARSKAAAAAKKAPTRSIMRPTGGSVATSGTPPPTPPAHTTPKSTPPGTPGSEGADGKKISAWTLMETLYKYEAQKSEQLSHKKVYHRAYR